MLQEERHQKISELLRRDGSVRVNELVSLLGVSVDTVRRDLENMEKKHLLKRVHGGAVPLIGSGNRLTFAQRMQSQQAEKEEIAEKVCDYVREGQAVAINAGTTNIAVARKLAERFERLTVLTNGLHIIEQFAHKRQFTVIAAGGAVDYEEYAFYGEACERNIAGYNFDVAILSCNAISLERGLTDIRLHEPGVIRAMIDRSRHTIVAADSSKFETVAFLNVAPLERVDCIVTDKGISRAILQKYREENVIVAVPNDEGREDE